MTRCRPALLAASLFLTLLMKVLVPAGYMPAISGGAVTLQLCSGMQRAAPAMAAMTGMHHGDDAPVGDHGKPEQPCAFAGLGAPVVDAVDSSQVSVALAFVLLTALRAAPAIRSLPRVRLRPPLRAPPPTA